MEGPAYLEIRVPREGVVEYRPGGEVGWTSERTARPDEALRTASVWDAIRADDGIRAAEAHRLGLQLGDWLYDTKAAALLREHARAATKRLRVELCLPEGLQGYPWELAAPPEMLPLGVHHAFTVLRRPAELTPMPWKAVRRLTVLLIGVPHDKAAGLAPVLTEHELEGIRHAIGGQAAEAFNVEVHPCGSWKELVRFYEQREPPHIVHFAGHGLADGSGLVFRAADGGAEEVDVGRLVALLGSKKGQGTQLVFLNACYSAGSNRTLHPLGGMLRALHGHGIPAVIGSETLIRSCDAEALAREFYAQVAEGKALDVALQEARHSLHLGGNLAWPFVTLSVAGEPGPLVVKSRDSGSPVAPSLFGFDPSTTGFGSWCRAAALRS